MTIVEIEQLLLELQERVIALESKPKSKSKSKIKFEKSLSLDGYISLVYPNAKKTIERRLNVKSNVEINHVIEKAQADQKFMDNFASWKMGDDAARPTIYFNNGYGISQLQFGTAGSFAKKFDKNTEN